jgi:hypothetical protein
MADENFEDDIFDDLYVDDAHTRTLIIVRPAYSNTPPATTMSPRPKPHPQQLQRQPPRRKSQSL